jgi:integrase
MGRRCYRRPKDVPLDRVLFETAYACGTRAAEACGLYVEDLDPRTDDEHVRIRGPGSPREIPNGYAGSSLRIRLTALRRACCFG